MAKAPLVLQHDAAECGAACLAMILGFHGTHAPLDELRTRCGVSRNGSRASSVIAAAATYGLTGRGLRCEPEALRELPLPAILFWNFNHFVVSERFDRAGGARLLDPALGRRQVTSDELNKAFTGVVLTFAPGRDFVATGTRPKLWPMLRERLAGTERAFRLLPAFAILAAIPLVLMPALLRVFIDDVLLRGQWRWLNALVTITVATALFQMISIAFRRRLLVAIESWTITSGEARFLEHLLSLPLGFFGQRHTGELIDRLGAFTRFAVTLTGPLADGISGAITAIILLAAALVVDPVTGLVVLLAAIACAVATWSVLGSVTRTVSGNGILIAQGGQLVDAQSSGPGQIAALSVRPGSQVEAGAVIATVIAADREQRLSGARMLVTERQQNLGRIKESIDQLAAQRDTAAALQRQALESKMAVIRERIGTAGTQFDIQNDLFHRGLATLQRVNDARDALNAARLDEANTQTALADLKAKQADGARADADRLNQSQDELAAAQRSVAELEVELALSSSVRAPVPGRVVEVKANLGAMMNAGQAIVSIETGQPGLELLAFIPAQSARDVRPGMEVRISPAGTRREEHGELLGTVLDVSSFPMNATGLRSLLQNETLAETLSHAGAPHVARVALTDRPNAPGFYAWTTTRGEAVALSSGGLATIEVTASQHRPLELVLPAVRKLFGM